MLNIVIENTSISLLIESLIKYLKIIIVYHVFVMFAMILENNMGHSFFITVSHT